MKKWAVLLLSIIIVLFCGEDIMALGFGPYFGYEYLTRNLDLKDIEHFYIFDDRISRELHRLDMGIYEIWSSRPNSSR